MITKLHWYSLEVSLAAVESLFEFTRHPQKKLSRKEEWKLTKGLKVNGMLGQPDPVRLPTAGPPGYLNSESDRSAAMPVKPPPESAPGPGR